MSNKTLKMQRPYKQLQLSWFMNVRFCLTWETNWTEKNNFVASGQIFSSNHYQDIQRTSTAISSVMVWSCGVGEREKSGEIMNTKSSSRFERIGSVSQTTK